MWSSCSRSCPRAPRWSSSPDGQARGPAPGVLSQILSKQGFAATGPAEVTISGRRVDWPAGRPIIPSPQATAVAFRPASVGDPDPRVRRLFENKGGP
jgi:hypothetical protein